MPSAQLDLLATDRTPRRNRVAEEHRRLKQSALRVIAYLQARQGEWVTNVELAHKDVGGLRFGGRIFELRAHGWIIEDQRPERGGVWRYRLIGKK